MVSEPWILYLDFKGISVLLSSYFHKLLDIPNILLNFFGIMVVASIIILQQHNSFYQTKLIHEENLDPKKWF